jgi:hypothetical protein
MKVGNKAQYVPMSIFPVEGDPIPSGKNGFLVFLDEINAAPMAVQSASYKLVLDRMVGAHRLHEKTAIVAAGNLTTDKAIVNRLSTAMQSRLVHLEIEPTLKDFIRWADMNDIDHRIKSFLNFKPEILYNFDPNHHELTYPSPRTWHFASKIIKVDDKLPPDILPILAGTIGEGAAREFYAFSKIYGEIPTIQEIMLRPDAITIAEEPSIQYALSGLVGYHLSVKNADKLMKFLSRLNVDFQVITLRSAIARNSNIKNTEAVKDWIRIHASELT